MFRTRHNVTNPPPQGEAGLSSTTSTLANRNRPPPPITVPPPSPRLQMLNAYQPQPQPPYNGSPYGGSHPFPPGVAYNHQYPQSMPYGVRAPFIPPAHAPPGHGQFLPVYNSFPPPPPPVATDPTRFALLIPDRTRSKHQAPRQLDTRRPEDVADALCALADRVEQLEAEVARGHARVDETHRWARKTQVALGTVAGACAQVVVGEKKDACASCAAHARARGAAKVGSPSAGHGVAT